MMSIEVYIINDLAIQALEQPIKNLNKLFNALTYTHIPIEKDGVYLGCISENDVRCFEKDKPVSDYQYALDNFFVRKEDNWLDVLEAFAKNNTNLMPVLAEESNTYLGYVELSDIMGVFSETPFLSEEGGNIVIEKGFTDYSFSEITQIVESNEGKLFGAFISKLHNDVAEITIKVNASGINEILQAFRRYGYKVLSKHREDSFYQNLKERSDYLDKYLNI